MAQGQVWRVVAGIVPTKLNDMILDSDPARVSRVTQAMFQMKKLDLAVLENAYRNEQ